MEATVVSVGKSVLNGALGYAKSAVAEEVALQLGVQRDQAFIRDELEMMQSFLMATHDERDDSKVVKTWVKQVRDVAYDVEDCLQDFAVRLEKPSWWRIPRTLLDRRRVAKQMKELRAKVEDVSQRNVRYHLIKGSGSKATSASELSSIAGATMSGIDEARRWQHNAKAGLVRLINNKDENLRVIAVWGTSDHLGETSVIRKAYDDLKIRKKFECRAWIRLMHPSNPSPIELLRSIIRQFYVSSLQEASEATPRGQVLRRMAMMKEDDLADAFKGYVNDRSYLIVLNDLSSTEEWDRIKTCFPTNRKGSRIIVSTQHVEVASLCIGPENVEPEHKQLSDDHTLYAFYDKGSEDVTDSTEPGSSSSATTACSNISEEGKSLTRIETMGSEDVTDSTEPGSSSNPITTCSNISEEGKSLTRTETMVSPFKEFELFGRVNEKSEIINLISKESQQLEVISVYGMGGLGKTTLVKDVYESQELSGKFEKRACVTVMRPFNKKELLKSLTMQLDQKSPGKTKSEDQPSLADLLEGKKYLIVLDDLSSTTEWDAISNHFPETHTACRIIVTTREENIVKHCSKKQENIYKLEGLEYKDAKGLFTKKVFNEDVNLDEQYPDLDEEAKLILKKCKGLPLAIVTIGGFLANQPKTVWEWRKLNEHISAELQVNPKLGEIRTVLDKSYDGLPYHLKSCFLYLSIFPEDHKVSRKRLARRWTVEGYSREVRDKSAEEIADDYFLELKDRSMILPTQKSMYSRKVIDSCQVHDVMRDISISKSMEENLVFRLEEGRSSSSPGIIRHLTITSSRHWEGDKSEFESMVDLSRVRSLTVFGKWRPFFISDKIRLLRVLDLEDTYGLHDHHLEHIGKLLHLKYLSLRGCREIFYLPDSLGNLRQLQTLDIRGTNIIKLPKTIINLQKLNYLRAGDQPWDERASLEEAAEDVPKLMRNRLCLLTLWSMKLCALCSAAPVLDLEILDGMSSRDVCTWGCCVLLPAIAMRLDTRGVVVPRGMRKLKALHTLGVVNIAQGKAVLQDIKGLTRLRKLGVTGVNKKNGKELCSAIADLRRLESLSIRSEGEPGLLGCLESLSIRSEGEPGLLGCLKSLSFRPVWSELPLFGCRLDVYRNLESLKLYGNLVKLPEWIARLKNLVKLKLRSTRLSEHDMQVLGNLPNLAILRLLRESFQGEELHFQREGFRRLVILELDRLHNIKSVKFDQGAMPKLEQLQLRSCTVTNENGFSGLQFLPSIKEVLYDGFRLKEQLRAQLAENPKQPILKVD